MAIKNWKLQKKGLKEIVFVNTKTQEKIILHKAKNDKGWYFGDSDDKFIKHHDLKSDTLSFAKKYMRDN